MSRKTKTKQNNLIGLGCSLAGRTFAGHDKILEVQSLYPINRMWWYRPILPTLETKAEGLKFTVTFSYISSMRSV